MQVVIENVKGVGDLFFSTINLMTLRAIWDKQPEVYFDVFQNRPKLSEGDLLNVKMDQGVYFPKIAQKSYVILG